ncbi:hypothetical protein ACHAXT_001636 [Thalassiosira profunda]
MSSQESTAALLPSRPASAPADAPSKGRGRAKKRRRRVHKPGPPTRLGWLGSGLSASNDAEQHGGGGGGGGENNMKDGVGSNGGSQSSGELLTPRPASAGEAVDLTGDGKGGSDVQDSPTATAPSNNGGREKAGGTADGTQSRKQGEWACRRCTLQNPGDAACEACGARKESARKHGETRGGEGGSSDEKGTRSSNDGRGRKPSKKSGSKNGDKGALRKWASSSQSQSQSQSTSRRSASSRSSGRRSASSGASKKRARGSGSSEMWIDKHAPRTSKELCVAPKKVEEVRQFLSSHVEYVQSRREGRGEATSSGAQPKNPWDEPDRGTVAPQCKLMVLVGSPGVGKSAMVRALAHEMRVEILTWDDAHAEFNAHHHHGGEYIPYQSQLSSFEEFLARGGAGMESLAVGGAGDTSSDSGRKRARGTDSRCEGSVILIEEVPNLYSAEAVQSFQNIMERHVRRTQTPTVLIFSDVREGKHKPEDLERLVPPGVLYSEAVHVLQIQPVTKAKMKKCLGGIAKAEGIRGSLSPEFYEEAHLSSGGDVRHAIFAMQFRCSARDSGGGGPGNSKDAKKDAKLSTFHALGKLLYAKRKRVVQYDSDLESVAAAPIPKSKWDDGRGPLEFVPEEVLDQVDMGVGSAISFLSYHCPDFFTDVTDLSRSLDHFSDAAAFLDRFGQDDGPFPTRYASCLGGRAVADGNKHPAPPQFRQFSAPKLFAVLKKNRENEARIGQLRKRLSVGGGAQTSMHDNVGSAQQFVTDSLPYMRAVIPQEVDYALANLHSYAKDSNGRAPADSQPAAEEENNVLLEDDLVDDDDDDDDGW